MNIRKFRVGLALFVALAVLMVAALGVQAKNENPGIQPINSNPGGMSYGEWGAEWWRWVVGIPFDENPLIDPDGSFALTNQEHCPVVFLAGTWYGSQERWVTVKPGTKLYIPMLNYMTSTAWDEDVNYGAAVAVLNGQDPNQLSDEELIRLAANYWLNDATATDITLEIDGVAVENPHQYWAESPDFVIEDDPMDFGVVGYTEVTVSYAAMLTPLTPGEHDISVSGAADPPDGMPPAPPAFSYDVTYHITVQPGAPSPCGG